MDVGFENATTENLLSLIQQYDTNFAQNNGYDAVRYGDEIVVFEPNQIKSVKNNGEFSKKTNNINENIKGSLRSF